MNADQPKKINHSWKKGSYGKVVSLNALCQIMMGPRRYKKSRVNCVALLCMPNALQLFLSTTRRVSSTIKAHHFTEHGNISPWRFSWFCSFWPSLPKVRKIKFFGFAVFLVLQLRFFFLYIATEITISASAVAVLLGAKILALKGFLIGGLLARGRGRREAPQDLAKVILEASLKDQYDCTKRLICELHAQPFQQLQVSTFRLPVSHTEQ